VKVLDGGRFLPGGIVEHPIENRWRFHTDGMDGLARRSATSEAAAAAASRAAVTRDRAGMAGGCKCG
jgi:hypothetical protein